MKILRPVLGTGDDGVFHIARYFKELLMKRGNAFTCCAACGELPFQPGNRLCVSLTADWPVDIVVSGEAPMDKAIPAIRRYMSWARRIHVWPGRLKKTGADLAALPEGAEEPYLHQVSTLAENFIVLRATAPPLRACRKLDFFTPNGIPLVFIRQEDAKEPSSFAKSASSRSKTLTGSFAKEAGAESYLGDPEGYAKAFAAWACKSQHAIFAPYPQE